MLKQQMTSRFERANRSRLK